MIVITGAAGFIGSCLVSRLNQRGHKDLILVDDISKKDCRNLQGKFYDQYIDRLQFQDWFKDHATSITFVFHIGARTDTTEINERLFDLLNYNYSRRLWELCADYDVPFLYASSAATYGNGEMGYSDDHGLIPMLQPLNPYGWSKQKMDQWVLVQEKTPSRWAGFKFFNVFGPNEYHKGRMASVIFHAFHQIHNTGRMKLFKSNEPGIADGEQKRDFIYVMDVLDVLMDFYDHVRPNGIYNLGTGKANSFLHLVENTFEALGLAPKIEFIDMPQDLMRTYQNYTCAEMQKLHQVGYVKPMSPFGQSIQEYVQYYLSKAVYF